MWHNPSPIHNGMARLLGGRLFHASSIKTDSCIHKCCVMLQEEELIHVLILQIEGKKIKRGKSS